MTDIDANTILQAKGPEGLRTSIAAVPRDSLQPAQEKAAQPKVRLLSPAEFLDNSPIQSTGIIPGLLRTRTIVAVGSRPGLGKTALLVKLAECLTSEQPFLGRPVERSSVAYFAYEDATDAALRLLVCNVTASLPDHVPLLTVSKEAKEILIATIRALRKDNENLPVVLIIDTLRAALGDVSVLEDRVVSPALNMLRSIAEQEQAVIVIANHTNRENPKALKGETLEAVAALELILLPGEPDWSDIHIGKNRNGPGTRKIGRFQCTSEIVNGAKVAVIGQLEADEKSTVTPRKTSAPNQELLRKVLREALDKSGEELNLPAGEKVVAVRQDAVEELFFISKPGSKDTVRNGFGRALDTGLSRGLIQKESRGGTTYLWLR